MSAATLPEVGATVELRHTRFGKATVKILAIDGEWIDTEVVAGLLIGIMEQWGRGKKKTVRAAHCTFYPIKNQQPNKE